MENFIIPSNDRRKKYFTIDEIKNKNPKFTPELYEFEKNKIGKIKFSSIKFINPFEGLEINEPTLTRPERFFIELSKGERGINNMNQMKKAVSKVNTISKQFQYGSDKFFNNITATIENMLKNTNVDNSYYTLVIEYYNENRERKKRYYNFNATLIFDLEKLFSGGIKKEEHGSDPVSILAFNDVISYKFDIKTLNAKNPNMFKFMIPTNGGFFKYYNDTEFDFTRYMIYTKADLQKEENLKIVKDENCFIYALKMAGIEKVKLDNVKNCIKSSHLKTSEINQIVKDAEVCVILSKLTINHNTGKEVIRTVPYGIKTNPTYRIALYDNHYFVNEVIPYRLCIASIKDLTRFSLKKLSTITRIKTNGTFEYEKTPSKTTSLAFIRALKANNYFSESIKDSRIAMVKEEKDILPSINEKHVEYGTNDFQATIDKSEERKVRDLSNLYTGGVFFADTETNPEQKPHMPFCISYKQVNPEYKISDRDLRKCLDREETILNNEIGITKNLFGKNCIIKFLNMMPNESLMICHNLQYDFSVIRASIDDHKLIEKDGKLYGGHIIYKGKKIYMMDSYLMISVALSKFGPMFGLEISKDVCPYNYYTLDLDYNKTHMIKDIKEYFNSSKYKQFRENCEELFPVLYENGQWDPKKYAIYYCNKDVDVLTEGYLKFRDAVFSGYGVDTFNYLTISSLADNIAILSGVYDGVHSLKGVLRNFIQKTVVGGQCRTYENKTILKKFDIIDQNKKSYIKDFIEDFDAVSAYPTAMVQMKGMPIGKPTYVNKPTYTTEKVNYLGKTKTKRNFEHLGFYKIKITCLNKKRSLPLYSIFNNETKSYKFTNDLVGRTIIIDSLTLGELIFYHKITYTYICGCEFQNGYNTRVKEFVYHVFNTRKQLKNERNKLEVVYKLLLNSLYGKNGLKPTLNKTKYFNDKDKFDDYVERNFNMIKHWEVNTHTYFDFNNQSITYETYSCDIMVNEFKHENRAHISSLILAQSKILMGSVINLAIDLGLKVYYQDTDSLHITHTDLTILCEKYQEIYQKNLVGKELGEFHCDFSRKDGSEAVSCAFITIGKKMYSDQLIKLKIDALKPKDEFGNPNYVFNKELEAYEIEDGNIEYHTRAKGITLSSLQYVADNQKKSTFELYEGLHTDLNSKLEVDLLCEGNAVKMAFNHKAHNVQSVDKFIRTIRCMYNYEPDVN